jgi:hypothetical protein
MAGVPVGVDSSGNPVQAHVFAGQIAEVAMVVAGVHGSEQSGVEAGHIEMFDGEIWISDFKQTGSSGFWAGPNYKAEKVKYAIYRYVGNWREWID